MNHNIILKGGWQMKIIGYEPSESKPPFKVDRWYDRHTKSWVVQLKDEDGNQIGNATYLGVKQQAITEENRMKIEHNL